MNPFRKDEDTESNRPLIGNDFKLIYGNRNKSDHVVCEAQKTYKEGDCYVVEPEPETCTQLMDITLVGCQEKTGTNISGTQKNGTSVSSYIYYYQDGVAEVKFNTASGLYDESGSGINIMFDNGEIYFFDTNRAGDKYVSEIKNYQLYMDSLVLPYSNFSLCVIDQCLGYSTYKISPESYYGSHGYDIDLFGQAEHINGPKLELKTFITEDVEEEYETTLTLSLECQEDPSSFWYEIRNWGSTGDFRTVTGSLTGDSSATSADETFTVGMGDQEVRIHFGTCSEGCISLKTILVP